MSESKGTLRARGNEESPISSGDGSAATSIGAYLKRERLVRGIEIEDLAATTRIPLRSLVRLEAGYFDGVTDGFVRGFVRTVAVALGLDADQTVARMLDEPVASPWDREGVGLWRKQVLALLALVAASALGVLLLRAGWKLLVGGDGAARSREIVMWRDPVHELARDVAAGRFVVHPDPTPDPDPDAGPASDRGPERQAPTADVEPGSAGSAAADSNRMDLAPVDSAGESEYDGPFGGPS